MGVGTQSAPESSQVCCPPGKTWLDYGPGGLSFLIPGVEDDGGGGEGPLKEDLEDEKPAVEDRMRGGQFWRSRL